MCLIALAHRASKAYPLVIAANRDEDFERPTHDAHFWPDAPEVLGGRDGVHGGAWLAITRRGRFAAITNLRGVPKAPNSRSRGELVSGFVRGNASPVDYVAGIALHAHEYTPFHLFVGEIGGDIVHFSRAATILPPLVHGISNAPVGERWPKVDEAIERTTAALALSGPEAITRDLLQFLATDRGSRQQEREPFIQGERYGTRSSTVIVATQDEVWFTEQSWGREAVAIGEPRVFRLPR